MWKRLFGGDTPPAQHQKKHISSIWFECMLNGISSSQNVSYANIFKEGNVDDYIPFDNMFVSEQSLLFEYNFDNDLCKQLRHVYEVLCNDNFSGCIRCIVNTNDGKKVKKWEMFADCIAKEMCKRTGVETISGSVAAIEKEDDTLILNFWCVRVFNRDAYDNTINHINNQIYEDLFDHYEKHKSNFEIQVDVPSAYPLNSNAFE